MSFSTLPIEVSNCSICGNNKDYFKFVIHENTKEIFHKECLLEYIEQVLKRKMNEIKHGNFCKLKYEIAQGLKNKKIIIRCPTCLEKIEKIDDVAIECLAPSKKEARRRFAIVYRWNIRFNEHNPKKRRSIYRMRTLRIQIISCRR